MIYVLGVGIYVLEAEIFFGTFGFGGGFFFGFRGIGVGVRF